MVGNRNAPNREFLFPGDNRGFHHPLLKTSQHANSVSLNNDPVRFVHHCGKTFNLVHKSALNYTKDRTRSGRSTSTPNFDKLTTSHTLALTGFAISMKRANRILTKHTHISPSQSITKRTIEVRPRIHKCYVRLKSKKRHVLMCRSQFWKHKFQSRSVAQTDVKLLPSCVHICSAHSPRRRVHAKSPTVIDAQMFQFSTGKVFGLNNKDKKDHANLSLNHKRAKPVKWFSMQREVEPLFVEVQTYTLHFFLPSLTVFVISGQKSRHSLWFHPTGPGHPE
jgi:hypothetical protein